MSTLATVYARSPSVSVIETVAAREGVDPTELDVPLYEVIDPEALDRLIETAADRGDESDIQLSFSYYGYEVAILADGTVHVTGDGRSTLV